jgi:hypothetical protein
MKELLEKWATLEPARCEKRGYYFTIKPDDYAIYADDSGDRETLHIIQAAVEEAIDERGWARQVSNLLVRPEDEGYRSVTGAGGSATVSRLKNGIYDSTAEHFSVQADTASTALLFAYLEALAADLLGERE